MADRGQAFPENVTGSFFVDDTCIDCGTCYSLAPAVFEDAGGHSRVHHQPAGGTEKVRAGMALASDLLLIPVPGHGQTFRADSPAGMRRELERGIEGLGAA